MQCLGEKDITSLYQQRKKLTLALKITKKNETQTKKELNKAVNKGSD